MFSVNARVHWNAWNKCCFHSIVIPREQSHRLQNLVQTVFCFKSASSCLSCLFDSLSESIWMKFGSKVFMTFMTGSGCHGSEFHFAIVNAHRRRQHLFRSNPRHGEETGTTDVTYKKQVTRNDHWLTFLYVHTTQPCKLSVGPRSFSSCHRNRGKGEQIWNLKWSFLLSEFRWGHGSRKGRIHLKHSVRFYCNVLFFCGGSICLNRDEFHLFSPKSLPKTKKTRFLDFNELPWLRQGVLASAMALSGIPVESELASQFARSSIRGLRGSNGLLRMWQVHLRLGSGIFMDGKVTRECQFLCQFSIIFIGYRYYIDIVW